MPMPAQKPHRSDQEKATPRDFVRAVEKRWGVMDFDLAADFANTVCPDFFSKEEDSLQQDWVKLHGNLWLNPEFGQIEPFAEKACETFIRKIQLSFTKTRKDRLFMLTPASIGSVWFAEHVHHHALVLGIRPRLVFIGEEDPYPKDLMLSVYGCGPGFDVWKWA